MLKLVLGLAFGALLAAAPAAKQDHAVTLKGCLAREGALSPSLLKGLPTHRRLVKVADSNGAYRAALEVEGYALKDVLDRAQVKKKVDDGFNRPLDVFFTIRGRKGQRTLVSWNEAFFAGDGGPLLVEKSRLVLPHHHSALKPGPSDPTVFLGPAKRDALKLDSCASCHSGEKPPVLAPPVGWLLVVPQDGFGGRFVEDVSEIRVHQIGISVVANKAGTKNTVVEAPELVNGDGLRKPLTPALFASLPRVTHRDATFGEGRGYHGLRAWEGIDLAALLRPLLPVGKDLNQVWVLVTAADGYRSVFSGVELFAAPEGRGAMLVDRINGQPLGPGSGKYHVVAKADFFIDRDVRLVKEIRIGWIGAE